MKRSLLLTSMLLALLTWGVVAAQEADSTKTDEPDSAKSADDSKVTTELGVTYKDLEVGEGPAVKMGTKTTVHYTLWLDNGDGTKGKKIQSSKDRNQPFDCTVGYRLIPGWSDGMVGMKEGGVRRLWIPSKLAYGPRGMPPMIPGNADLIFEIELLKVNN